MNTIKNNSGTKEQVSGDQKQGSTEGHVNQ